MDSSLAVIYLIVAVALVSTVVVLIKTGNE